MPGHLINSTRRPITGLTLHRDDEFGRPGPIILLMLYIKDPCSLTRLFHDQRVLQILPESLQINKSHSQLLQYIKTLDDLLYRHLSLQTKSSNYDSNSVYHD